jgi:adenine-specific DNA-methyltransferase
MAKKSTTKTVVTLKHDEAKRKNIPTAEYQSVLQKEQGAPRMVKYPRNTDLDPQLVWRGKDEQDWSDLVVHAPPLYIQEKVQPKVLIDDLLKQTRDAKAQDAGSQADLFADFNGIPEGVDKTEFYQHEQNWSNRMILGDSLQVMASLAEREGLRGKVQCIYLDPPYGIKFNSNFQWSTTSRDVKDGNAAHITREPEQVKAFRDTWRDGIHSYLTYLRDRLTVARDLLSPSGSIFVQIGVENIHYIRALLDEVFGPDNFACLIAFRKKAGSGADRLPMIVDYIVWYAKDIKAVKYRQLFWPKAVGSDGAEQYTWLESEDGSRARVGLDAVGGDVDKSKVFRPDKITNARPAGTGDVREFIYEGRSFNPGSGTFLSNQVGLERLAKARRLVAVGNTLSYVRFLDDFPAIPLNSLWDDTSISGFGEPKIYVVQTLARVIQRCIVMTTDPGDLVLDPTCGSGTTATVAEQWGRR